MEPVVAEQPIGRMRLTFPNRIFEVCHLMQRENEVEFFAETGSGDINNVISVSKPDDDHVSVSLTVRDLTFDANDLCFFVDQVIPKNPETVDGILARVTSTEFKFGHNRHEHQRDDDDESTNQKDVSTQTSSLEEGSNKPHSHFNKSKKKKVHVIGHTTSSAQLQDHNDDDQGDLQISRGLVDELEDDCSIADDVDCQSMSLDSDEGVLVTPSGRRIRKPARFRNTVAADALDGRSDGKKEGEAAATKSGQSSDMVGDVHVVVEKRKRGRPRKSLPEKSPAEEDPDKKPHAGRGKKRPNYKREANIECRLCHNMYKDELSLISHLQKMHPKDPSLTEYIAELKEQAKVQCKICGKTLGNKRNEMASHMLRVHGKDDDFVSKCEECGMEFKRSFLLKEHIRRQHPKHDRILCHLCPASFKLKEYLTEHIKYTHNKQFKWQCNICHKMTSSPKNLRRHKRLHDGYQYRCPVCCKMFSEAGNLKRHVLYVHNSDQVTRRTCPHCDRDFTTKNNLIQHINMVHLKTTAFYCDICKKYFLRKKQLIEHAATVHPGVPILSTKMDDDVTLANQGENTPLSVTIGSDQGHQQTFTSLEEVGGAAGQATIILQGADGSEHVLVAHQGLDGQTGAVSDLQQQVVGMRAGGDDLHNTINLLGGDDAADQAVPVTDSSLSLVNQQPLTAAPITDGSLSLVAQHALAAFEAGELDTADFGPDHYLTVIGEDGQEIRVQIVRKDPNDETQDTELESIYAQAAVSNVGLGLTEHVESEVSAPAGPVEEIPATALQPAEQLSSREVGTAMQLQEKTNQEYKHTADQHTGTSGGYINSQNMQMYIRDRSDGEVDGGTVSHDEVMDTQEPV